MKIIYLGDLFDLLRRLLDLDNQEIIRSTFPPTWLKLGRISHNSFRKFSVPTSILRRTNLNF